MRLIVSIHDITPRRVGETLEWRETIAAMAGGPVSLLVVPRYAGLGSWRHGAGAAALVDLAEAGDEVVVHGYTHTLDGHDGAETRHHDAAGARALVSDGAWELRAAGLRPDGFIAPAYGRLRDAGPACAGAGLMWWATRSHLWTGDLRIALPSLGLGASTPLRRVLSPAVARGAVRALRGAPVLRLDLHTADLHHPRLATAGRDLLSRLLDTGRLLVTHRQVAAARIAGARAPSGLGAAVHLDRGSRSGGSAPIPSA